MIFLSFLSWLQIFGLFIITILTINSFINYPKLLEKTDRISLIQKSAVKFIIVIYQHLLSFIIKLLYTRIGIFIYKNINEMNIAYLNSKGLIRQKVIEMVLNMRNNRMFTPRISTDDEDTDDDT